MSTRGTPRVLSFSVSRDTQPAHQSSTDKNKYHTFSFPSRDSTSARHVGNRWFTTGVHLQQREHFQRISGTPRLRDTSATTSSQQAEETWVRRREDWCSSDDVLRREILRRGKTRETACNVGIPSRLRAPMPNPSDVTNS